MAIKNSVSNDLRPTFVDSINVFDCRIPEVFIEYRPTEYIARTIRNKGYYELFNTFFIFLLKKRNIPDMRQLKTLLTIDEGGSEIASTSVFDCQWSPVRRLMAIGKSVSNYFWSRFVDNIDVFDCHQSGLNSLYASLYNGGLFCIQLKKIIWNCLCLKGRYITMTI